MHQQPFFDALVTAKLLQLAARYVGDNVDAKEALGAIIKNVEMSVATLALSPRPATDARIAEYLDYLSSSLFDYFGQLDIDSFVGLTSATAAARAATFGGLACHVSGSYPGDDGDALVQSNFTPTTAETVNVIQAFRILVLHTEWLSTLVALGADMATEQGNRALAKVTRSSVTAKGREQVKQAMAVFEALGLGPDETEVCVTDVMEVTVKLDAGALAQMPRARELSIEYHDVEPRLCDLLAAAAKPQVMTPGVSAKSVAIERMARFVAGLDERAAALEAARAGAPASDPALEARKSAAVAKLREMGDLAAILREFPELLDRA
jgi:hypothetical protein